MSPPVHHRNASMFNKNKMKLGIFATNCSHGITATTVPEHWKNTWENNLTITKLADEAGIECMIPVARWRGYGGETNFEHETFETITWATGLLAHTEHITVFGTVHAPFIHPIVAAKQLVTADHVGQGRMGLNIVAGWNFSEFGMFGEAPLDHDDRYAYGQEWWDIVQRVWTTTEPFDYHGKHFQIEDVVGDPKPWGNKRPVVMNAGGSDIGRAFGATNFDCLFTALRDPDKTAAEIADNKKIAKESGNASLDVYTNSLIVCRPTRKEAEEYYQYACNEKRDHEAVEKLLSIRGIEADKIPAGYVETMRTRFVGHGLYPIVGDPDDVAKGLGELSDMGFDGTSISWVDYIPEFEYFAAEVMPRLENLGLREPFNGT